MRYLLHEIEKTDYENRRAYNKTQNVECPTNYSFHSNAHGLIPLER